MSQIEQRFAGCIGTLLCMMESEMGVKVFYTVVTAGGNLMHKMAAAKISVYILIVPENTIQITGIIGTET